MLGAPASYSEFGFVSAGSKSATAAVHGFDGIVCFGGVDWWYHNRGHYDLQMMRELSATMPVLYINSIGMRVPGAGGQKHRFARIARKLRSIARGCVRVRPGMSVYSPFALPAGLGQGIARRALAMQVRRAARSLGISRPLVWIACPPAIEVLPSLQPSALVYQRTDRFEDYPGVARDRIAAYDRMLKARADVTLFCSSLLLDAEGAQCRRALFADHGVDFDHFAAAGDNATPPAALASIPRPRIGYIGNLEPHRVDHALLRQIAIGLPDMHFVIVGPGALDPALSARPNVHRFPQQPYEDVARFMAGCDVLIMPWNDNAWIRACNPVKLKEYLAVGRPVVTTPFEELRRYPGVVRIASDPAAFIAALRDAVRAPVCSHPARNRVRDETWAAKARLVSETLREQAIHFRPASS